MAEANASADPLIGRVIAGKLRILSCLGKGATGAVYRAHHETLDKSVAIKVLHETHVKDEELVRRFKAEAKAASRLDHPNSVRVLDFGADGPDGLLYLAMEFVAGSDLQSVLNQEGKIPPARTVAIMTQVTSALAVAHDQGVVHRDMKPGNIMLLQEEDEDGRKVESVKVCDFGLAKLLDINPEGSSGPLTQNGTIFGTPTYMSPEQASGKTLDGRTDIYSCGIILYRMLAGAAPFNAQNITGLLMKHIMETPVPLAESAPWVEPRLAAIVDRALQKEPGDRQASMREMHAELRALAQEMYLPLATVPAIASPSAPPIMFEASEGEGAAPMAASVGSVSQAPAGSKGAIPIALIGSLALIVVGGLVAYVLLERAPGAVVTAAPPKLAQVSPPPKVEPAPMPVLKPVPKSSPPPAAKVEAPAIEAPAIKTPPARSPKTPKRRPRRATAPKKTPPVKDRPRPVESPAIKAEIEAPKAKPPEPPPPPPPVEPPPPPVKVEPPPPSGPPKLGADFQFSAKIESVKVLQGGLSTRRITKDLSRALSEANACLRGAVQKRGVATSGRAQLKAMIGLRGRLRKTEVDSPLSEASGCLKSSFEGMRTKRPDTGDAYISFAVRYSASP